MSAVTADRKHALKIGARTALRRALNHKARVQPRSYNPGDLVCTSEMILLEKEAKLAGLDQRPIGAEGQNYWTVRGGRYILAAREHLRPADHEEVSLTLRIKAAIKELQKTIDKDFEEMVDDEAMPEIDLSGIGGGKDVEMSKATGSTGANLALEGGLPVVPQRRRKAKAVEVENKELAKQTRLLDDVPQSVRQSLRPHQTFYVKKNLVGEIGKVLRQKISMELHP